MKKNIKKKSDSLMGLAKESMGVGVTLGAGHLVMGGMAGISGMPAAASGAIQSTSAGLNLVGVGQMAKVGMALPGLMSGETKKKKSGNKYVDRII